MHERCALHNYSLAQNSLYRAPRNDPTPFVDIATVIAGLGSTPQSGFVVDLGAGVRDSDPCFPLFDAGYAGLMVDGDPAQRPKMRQRIPSSRVAQEIALLSPANVAGMLRAAGAPAVPDLVKIDIDSFDMTGVTWDPPEPPAEVGAAIGEVAAALAATAAERAAASEAPPPEGTRLNLRLSPSAQAGVLWS